MENVEGAKRRDIHRTLAHKNGLQQVGEGNKDPLGQSGYPAANLHYEVQREVMAPISWRPYSVPFNGPYGKKCLGKQEEDHWIMAVECIVRCLPSISSHYTGDLLSRRKDSGNFAS